MPAYRLYYLDGMGKVTSAEWIEADGDDAAVEMARSLNKGVRSELWQGSRLVGQIDAPNGSQA